MRQLKSAEHGVELTHENPEKHSQIELGARETAVITETNTTLVTTASTLEYGRPTEDGPCTAGAASAALRLANSSETVMDASQLAGGFVFHIIF